MSETTVPAPSPSVSIVVPVKNESGNIGPLVDEIAAAMADRSFEVICVDDGSRDGTAEVLSTLQAERPWLRHLKHVVSCGQSAALRSGDPRAPMVRRLTATARAIRIPPELLAARRGRPAIGLAAGCRDRRAPVKNCSRASPTRCA
jgi:dolichol-phosphate mannosyltransferase